MVDFKGFNGTHAVQVQYGRQPTVPQLTLACDVKRQPAYPPIHPTFHTLSYFPYRYCGEQQHKENIDILFPHMEV